MVTKKSGQSVLCPDCERRPLPKDGGRERCWPCQQRWNDEQRNLEADAVLAKERKRWTDPLNYTRYHRFWIWKGHLVGFWSGNGFQDEQPVRFTTDAFYYLKTDPSDDELAKLGRALVDMNQFQPGFPKEWVKQFKRMILSSEKREGQRLDWDGQI